MCLGISDKLFVLNCQSRVSSGMELEVTTLLSLVHTGFLCFYQLLISSRAAKPSSDNVSPLIEFPPTLHTPQKMKSVHVIGVAIADHLKTNKK